jgi:hypothetical protein
MKNKPEYFKRKEVVSQALKDQGWEVVDSLSFNGTSAVATKEFETAVGKKEAVAYLESWKDGFDMLTVDYQSEGRNIVQSQSFSIRPGFTEPQIQSGTTRFCNKVEAGIDKSFARKIHLPQSVEP